MAGRLVRAFGELLEEPLRNGLNRPKKVRGQGVKMVNMGELFAHDRIGDVAMEYVPLSDTEAERFLLRPGDLLFARQSLVLDGAGKCSVFLGASEPVTYEGHIIRARIDTTTCDPLFYYYFFQSPEGRASIASIVEQVAAAGIRGSDLARVSVPYPKISEQRAIAHILGTLDDKIDLNRRRNETLEAIARAIFKSWFVDFDPVRAKMRGEQPAGLAPEIAALFPDALVETELGEAPEGWMAGILGDVARHVQRTVRPDQLDPGIPYIALEHMPKQSIALSLWGSANGIASNKYEFKTGEFLFGKLRSYFHKVGIAPCDGVCSTDIVVVVPESTPWSGFVLGHISSVAFVEYTNAHSTGTKMPRTNWADMARYPVVVPSTTVASAYTNQLRPVYDRIIANIHETVTIEDIRDTLLPKLISGELRVADAERIVEERVG